MSIFRLLEQWMLHAFVLTAIMLLVPGFRFATASAAFVAVLIIGFLNTTFGVLLNVITLPVGMLTLAVFCLAVNATILVCSSRLAPGFQVEGLLTAFAGAAMLAPVQLMFTSARA